MGWGAIGLPADLRSNVRKPSLQPPCSQTLRVASAHAAAGCVQGVDLFSPQHASKVFSWAETWLSVSGLCGCCAVSVLACETWTCEDLRSLQRGFCNEPHGALLLSRALSYRIAC